MAINLCGQMDLFSMLGDIGGKPYNNMTISADMPSAFSGKTENENSDNLDDYLSVEEKILTLLKKKKEMKLTTNSEIYSIFSKKKIEEEDMEYISDKLEGYMRELLLDCVSDDMQEENFKLSDTLEDLMGYSTAADYIRHFDFINRGNMACSQFQIVGTRGVKPYYQLVGYESYEDLPVYLSINKMKKRSRGRCYYRTGKKKYTMHKYFDSVSLDINTDIIYIDSANEFDFGTVVAGFRNFSGVQCPDRTFYFPDVLKSRAKKASQLSCGAINISAPQHYVTNQLAATITFSQICSFIENGEYKDGVTYFHSFNLSVSNRPLEDFLADTYRKYNVNSYPDLLVAMKNAMKNGGNNDGKAAKNKGKTGKRADKKNG